MQFKTTALDEHCSRHEASLLLRDALAQLAARTDQLAAGDPSQPDHEAVVQYMDALELAISRCLARPELGCWLDILCPLKENLRSLEEYAEAVGPAHVDPKLVTAAVVVTHLTLSLQQRPTEALVREVLSDVMAASVWPWPLPAAARLEFRAAFGHPATPSRVSPRNSRSLHCELESPAPA